MSRSVLTPEERLERRRASYRKYAANHREQHKATALASQRRNAQQHRERSRAYYYAHREERIAYVTAHRTDTAKYSTRISAYNRKYSQAHPDRIVMKSHRYRARKASAPINDVTLEQQHLIIASAHGVCVYCAHYKPECKACKKHSHKLTIDHITALAAGGNHTLHNLIACCRSCNSRKHKNAAPVPVQPLLL